jgi:hypothetical protein
MKLDRVNVNRCARTGGQRPAGGASTLSTYALFNNQVSGRMFVIRSLLVTVGSNSTITLGVAQSPFTGTAQPINALIASAWNPPGSAATSIPTTATTGDYTLSLLANQPLIYQQELPFAIYPPNFSFFVQCLNANIILNVGITYEVIRPEELYAEEMIVADIAALAAQGG